MDSVYGPLPSSIHIYRSAEKLDGRPFIAYYLSARLKDKGLLFTTQIAKNTRYTPSQFFQYESNPIVLVNGGFFSYQGNQNISLVVRNGKILGYNVKSLAGNGPDSSLYYYPTRGALGISRKGKADVAWVFNDSSNHWAYAFEWNPVIAKGEDENPSIYDLNDINWKWWKVRTAIGGGPVLIHDGRIFITDREEEISFGKDSIRPATAIGYTSDDRLIILVVQGRSPGIAQGVSLTEEALILKELGCYEALNLDGGGSSCMLVNGMETIKPADPDGERPITSVFLIKSKPGRL